MKKYLAVLLLFGSTSAFSFSQVTESVFTSVKVESVNGGINPDYRGVKISGTVFVGGNACTANLYNVSIEKTLVGDEVAFKAIRTLKDSGIFCTKEIDPDFKGQEVSATFIMTADQLENAVVMHVNEEGNTVDIDSLLN